ncbi:MAG: Fe-S cluster assembly protein IscX [Treponema sp.]|nr:Fe-S cluster assembly protein IscX [Treponema sp.]MCL2252199.1 Fe-S cluster assembly protein IscX [Treponema sp.]
MTKLTLEDGSVYEGEIADGKPHGKGKLIRANGEIYEGDFKSGKYHGKGKLIYADGEVFDGFWGQTATSGIRQHAKAGDIYEGDFSDSQRYGTGKFTFAEGDVYEGGIYGGRFQDKGKMTYANGDVYEGDFSQNYPKGIGKFIYADGRIYEGEVEDSKPFGKGKMTYSDGKVEEGNWKKNGEKRTKEVFLEWADYIEIAQALNKLYPNRSPVAMSDSELIKLVTALPDFDGEAQPPRDIYLSFIANKWILVRDGGRTSTVDDSPFV